MSIALSLLDITKYTEIRGQDPHIAEKVNFTVIIGDGFSIQQEGWYVFITDHRSGTEYKIIFKDEDAAKECEQDIRRSFYDNKPTYYSEMRSELIIELWVFLNDLGQKQ